MEYICEFCKKTFNYPKHCYIVTHQNFCKNNPNHKVWKGHKQSDESKKKISENRKKFLKENPDKHPWRKNSKFISKPCEDFKAFLKSKNYKFEEEARVVPDRNYSVDICFPDLMLIFEINGNQHYDLTNMQLKPYYQERHDKISELGWTIVEVPYNQSYNEDFRMGVCRQLDARLSSKQSSESVWEFESPHPYILTLKEIQEQKALKMQDLLEKKVILESLKAERLKYKDLLEKEKLNRQIERLEKQEKKEEERLRKLNKAKEEGRVSDSGKMLGTKIPIAVMNERKNIILNSGIDITKFGWVGKMEKATGLSKHQIEDCVRFFNLNFFKRSSAL